jgi:branched-chain amino acid transport system ATP-binding protein
MSGGEQQMVALARALVGRPRLLMLDEPSLGLAPRLVDEVFGLVRKIRDEDVTILLVEQNVARALAVADDAHVLERGRLVASGRAADLLRSNLVQAAYLGAR